MAALDKMLFVQLEVVYLTSLQSGDAWPPFLKRWGGFGPPDPTIATPMYCYVATHAFLHVNM